MKILLFGGSGQLGFELIKRARDLNFEVVSPVSSEVNISDRDQILFLAEQIKPELIINSAAYTAVDKAEEEKEKAFLINRDGAGFAAEAAKSVGCRLIHLSTDYVFDGSSTDPISEDAPTNPLGVYGQSKLEGEEKVLSTLGEQGLVVRTSALHGQKGHNFVHTMVRLFAERDELKIVDDQITSTTWAGWLAEVVLDLGRIDCSGVLHACCRGAVSWFDFASEILSVVSPYVPGAEGTELIPIPSSEYPTPAKRPPYSVMDCSRLAQILGREPILWHDGLHSHLREIGYPPEQQGVGEHA